MGHSVAGVFCLYDREWREGADLETKPQLEGPHILFSRFQAQSYRYEGVKRDPVKQRAEMITLVLLPAPHRIDSDRKAKLEKENLAVGKQVYEGRNHCVFYSLVPSTMPGTNKHL